jgi:G3E family GTPase
MNRRLPITVVGGFCGAGKTSLLHQMISEHQGGNLAVLVENPGALNVDARSLRGLCGAMRRFSDVVEEFPALEEAEQVEWLAAKLREWAMSGRFERVLVEVSGTMNAARLGRYFGLLPGQSDQLAPWAELHQILCVVDALDFHRAVARRASPGALIDFQHAQIEGASLLVLNKCDLVDDAQRAACARLLRLINPDAELIETAYGELPPQAWATMGTRQHLALAVEQRLRPTPEGGTIEMEPTESALGSLVFRAYRPFHPERFWIWFNAEHPGLLRVKGLIWLATRNLLVGGVSRTRWQNACGGAGIWWAALPREEWPQDLAALRRMRETWREPYGDRRQELVLLGEAAPLAGLTRELNGCLLNDEELARPLQAWTQLTDPFPEWEVGEGS